MTEMQHKLQTAQAARVLQVTRKTVHRWAEDGTLPFLERIGDRQAYVFDAAAVRALAAKRAAALEEKLAALRAGGAA